MGLAATQARLLMLTSRQNDVEYQLMSLANTKLALSREAADASEVYSEALNTVNLTWTFKGDSKASPAELSYKLLMTPNPSASDQYVFANASTNKVLLTSSIASKLPSDIGNPGDMEKYFGDEIDLAQDITGKNWDDLYDYEQTYYTNLYDALNINGWEKNEKIGDEEYLQNQITNGNVAIMQQNSDWNSNYDDYEDMWIHISTSGVDSPMDTETDDKAIAKAQADYDKEQKELNYKEQKLEMQMNNLDTERSAIETEKESVQKIIDSNIKKFKIFENG